MLLNADFFHPGHPHEQTEPDNLLASMGGDDELPTAIVAPGALRRLLTERDRLLSRK